MKIKKIFQKIGRSNTIMKPLGVATSAAPPVSYLLTTSKIFNEVEIDGSEFVMITKELAKSLQGILILMMLLISIIYIYKPPKLITSMLVIGGIMIFASNLMHIIGLIFILYGLGLIFNNFTIDKLITRNNLLVKKRLEKETDDIIGGIK